MARKLIWGDFTPTHAVKVYRDSEWGEYVARILDKRTGKINEAADYFTSDKADAIGSARDMLKRSSNPRPRLGTAKPKRASSATGKAPTKRLIARRKANAQPGYFPNPGKSGVRIVHNKLLGGWYVVRGPHQTPLNGRFDTKEQAQQWLIDQRNMRQKNPTRLKPGRRALAAKKANLFINSALANSKRPDIQVQIEVKGQWQSIGGYTDARLAKDFARWYSDKTGIITRVVKL